VQVCACIYLLIYGLKGKHCNTMMKCNPVKVYRHFRAKTIASIRCLSAQVVVASICEVQENWISCYSDAIVFGLLLFSPSLSKYSTISWSFSTTFKEQLIREKGWTLRTDYWFENALDEPRWRVLRIRPIASLTTWTIGTACFVVSCGHVVFVAVLYFAVVFVCLVFWGSNLFCFTFRAFGELFVALTLLSVLVK
jgi:hypothetical protein